MKSKIQVMILKRIKELKAAKREAITGGDYLYAGRLQLRLDELGKLLQQITKLK